MADSVHSREQMAKLVVEQNVALEAGAEPRARRGLKRSGASPNAVAWIISE